MVEWLLTEGKCFPNPIDRFKRTPLEVLLAAKWTFRLLQCQLCY